MRSILLLTILAANLSARAQGYTNWFVGNTANATVQALGGVCLMGGATENDEAMRWFLQRANGGDVLVLRASGSNGYNNYFLNELGIPVNSVETIRFDNASAANEAYVHMRIQRAEAIWFAGGDQWNYVNYWRGTAIDSLINVAVTQRNIVIGGTSAGMAILGGVYFSAQNGTVTTASALQNPYGPSMTVDIAPFLQIPFLNDVVTDSHYDSPDRRGRHMAFMARAFTDHGIDAKGIACNEYTSVCVTPDGQARVFGEWPQYPEYAYFLQLNCEQPEGPELCQPGTPLTWNRGGQAVKAYKVPGTMPGTHSFDLNTWLTGNGGTWEDWSVQQGVFSAVPGNPVSDCLTTAVQQQDVALGELRVDMQARQYVLRGIPDIRSMRVIDALGREVPVEIHRTADGARLAWDTMPSGMHLLVVEQPDGLRTWRIFGE